MLHCTINTQTLQPMGRDAGTDLVIRMSNHPEPEKQGVVKTGVTGNAIRPLPRRSFGVGGEAVAVPFDGRAGQGDDVVDSDNQLMLAQSRTRGGSLLKNGTKIVPLPLQKNTQVLSHDTLPKRVRVAFRPVCYVTYKIRRNSVFFPHPERRGVA